WAKAPAASPQSAITVSVVLAARMLSNKFSGSGGGSRHATFSARAALTASPSRAATTPTKSPLLPPRAPPTSPLELPSAPRGFRAGGVGVLPARAHDAAVQHVGHAHVLHVHVAAARLGRNVDARHARADELVAVDRLLRRRAGELDVEPLVAEERAVGDRAGGVAVDRHHPFRHGEAPRLHAEPRRGEREH